MLFRSQVTHDCERGLERVAIAVELGVLGHRGLDLGQLRLGNNIPAAIAEQQVGDYTSSLTMNATANPSRAWVNGTYALRVVGHELGHNLGDYHSRSNSCDTTGCTVSEYGDDHDMMGATTAHFNAFQKERLGWLNYGASPPIQTVTQTNSYRLDPYEAPGTLPKALKILKSVDASGRRTWYYVETRAKMGYDSALTAGVLLHTGSEATGNSS